jgi:hypothetical protein
VAQFLGGYITPSGVYREGATETHQVLVFGEYDPTPSGENGTDRIEFTIVQPSGATSVVTTTTIAAWEQVFLAGSPLAGATAGKMAFVPCYGVLLDNAVLERGEIKVSAVAYSRRGTATVIPGGQIRYYNGKGLNIRPSQKIIHMDVTGAGSDSTGTGTSLSPVASFARALELCRKNPAGTTDDDRDAGGSKIMVHGPGLTQWFGTHAAGNPRVHTSGHWHVEIHCDVGVAITRGTFLFVSTPPGPGKNFRLTVVGALVYDGGIVVDIDNSANQETEVWIWWQGSLLLSSLWQPGRRWSCRYLETSNALMGFNNHLIHAHKVATGCAVIGSSSSWTNTWDLLIDCTSEDILAIHYLTVAAFDLAWAPKMIHCHGRNQSRFANVLGVIDTYVAGKAVVSSATGTHAGKVRIDLTADCYVTSFGNPTTSGLLQELSTLAEIANVPAWKLLVSGFGAMIADGAYTVLEAGVNNFGRSYCIIDRAFASGGSVPSGSAKVQTFWVASNQTYEAYVHPDLIQMFGNQSNGVIARCSFYDNEGAQGLFTGGSNLDNYLVVDNLFSCLKDFVSPMAGGVKTNCIFASNTFAGDLQLGTSATSPGTAYIDNISVTTGGYPISTAKIVTHNWNVSALVPGVQFTGTFFEQELFQLGWVPIPLLSEAIVGQASQLRPRLDVDRWSGVRMPTVGCPRPVGQRNYAISGSPLPVVDSGPAPASILFGAVAAGSSLAGGLGVGSQPSPITLAAPSGVGLVTRVDVGAPPATITMAAPAGQGFAGNLVEVGAPPATITLAAPSGAGASGRGDVGDPPATIALAAPAGSSLLGGIISAGIPPAAIVVRAAAGSSSVGEAPPTAPTITSGGQSRRRRWWDISSSIFVGRGSFRRRGHL